MKMPKVCSVKLCKHEIELCEDKDNVHETDDDDERIMPIIYDLTDNAFCQSGGCEGLYSMNPFLYSTFYILII